MKKFQELVTSESYESINDDMFALVQRIKEQLELEGYIDELLDKENIFISPGAYLLITVPLLEASYLQGVRNELGTQDEALDTDIDAMRDSLRKLLEEISHDPAHADQVPEELSSIDEKGERRPARSALSVIKAFFKKFCDIPPLCGETR